MRAITAAATLAAFSLAGFSLAGCDRAESPAQTPFAEAPIDEAAPEADAAPAAPAEPEPAIYAVPAGTPDHIRRAVESADRTDPMTERDAARKPAEILTLAGVEEGDRIVEFAGFGQYYTALLSEAVGPGGYVYVIDLPYTAERSEAPSRAFAESRGNVDYTLVDYNEMELPSDLDAVHIVLYYHDLPLNDVDTIEFNRKVFEALRPGGTYFIVDHNAPEGSGAQYTQSAHRIDPAVIRDEVLAAGFELAEESDILRNPDDDLTTMVFTPGVRGHTDQSVFVFRKPG